MAISATAQKTAPNAPVESLPDPRTAQKPTHFAFEHQVFSVKDAVFALSPSTGEAVYNVPLGDMRASLPIETVASSFNIGKNSTDAQLLQIVKNSLKFVKEIRPGDSIPSEILDGTASWKVEPHHRDIARARISVQLTSWMTGKHLESVDSAELETIAANPETKRKVQEALDVMAEKLGLTGDAKKDVVNRFDELAREMAYIEALRERFGKIQRLYANVGYLGSLYKRERSIMEDVVRIRALMKKPVESISDMFETLDANTGEIMNTMRKFAAQIRYIRGMRDDFHQRFMRWDELLSKWEGVPLEQSANLDRLIRQTYQFVARHFPQANDWGVSR
ncbi:MAG: hypothetical protein JO128_20645 [Alphaproteobacteria bacterium]|nr:hypothetical protein [Alphaproteobacteria bacterium]